MPGHLRDPTRAVRRPLWTTGRSLVLLRQCWFSVPRMRYAATPPAANIRPIASSTIGNTGLPPWVPSPAGTPVGMLVGGTDVGGDDGPGGVTTAGLLGPAEELASATVTPSAPST